MVVSDGSPGKTAPKLFNDFLFFDPVNCGSTSNYLAGHTPPVGEGHQLAPPIGSCKHDYTTKQEQSYTPPLDTRPAVGTEYKVAVCCKKCRIHADIQIAYTYAVNPCPNSQYPLHHFLRQKDGDYLGQEKIWYGWHCSAPECNARLRISYRRCRFSKEDEELLTNPERLKSRYEAMLREDPAREGLRQATPIESLSRLRKYIKDSLDPEHARRSFPANNKRFGEAFGPYGRDCYDLLQKLGFRYTEAHSSEEAQWQLPQPPPVNDRMRADGSTLREYLEDIVVELLALISKIASEYCLPNPAASEGWSSADRDVERTLAAQGYLRYSTLRRAAVSNEDLPYFASLGIQPDSADSLVDFAFDRQSLCDPAHRSYYLECLQALAQSRGTETLQTKVAMMASEGMVSRRDLTAAYRQLNIPHNEAQTVSDERILNLFYVRISDLGPGAQQDARQALNQIGMSRNSKRLINASMQTLETYEDALEWLGNGVDKKTADEALLAVVAIKTSDSVENQEFAQKAISIIARERKSNTLNDWLTTGQSTGYQMSPDEALRHLGVDHSWDTIDKSVLPVIFDAARNDRPGEQTERAVATLEQAMSGTAVNSHSPETWPVGLTSHGNTCYLNSILQYYFSIKPFREIILNYERHEFDTSVHEKKTERVGQRHVDMMEVKGGQRFAKDLKNLFERMIRDRSEHVRPEDDLVCRAFLEPKDYALLASGAQEVRDAQNSALNGTQEHAIEENVSADMTPTTVPAGSARNSSGASSVTLNGDDADMKMSNDDLPPTPPQSPGKQTGPKSDEAPPLPPRRFSTTREQALERAQEKAKSQQDVSEVHDDLTFRLRAGLEPKGKDESGEQEDELRDLYKIGITETIVKDGDDGKQKHMNDTGILLAPPSEATDIYSMLDTFFDLQVGGQTESGPTTEFYKTMRNLPPLLQINIPRILFEQETNRLYKSEASIKLEDELYLDRYVDSSDPETLPKRKACWGWRKRLHTLRKEQKVLTKTSAGLDGPTAISETAQYLNGLQDVNKDLESIGIEGLEVDGDLPTALLRDGLEISERLLILKTEIEELTAKLKDQFTVGKKHKYRLAAVFFHRGNFGHGHYWIYIHDFAADIWRVYNDERVEEFTKLDEIFEANTWNHGTPTFAVYVQDDRKLDIIQPVCRSPEKAPTPEPVEWSTSTGDVNMNGAGRDADASTGSRHGTFLAGVVEEGGQASWDEKRQVPGGNSW